MTSSSQQAAVKLQVVSGVRASDSGYSDFLERKRLKYQPTGLSGPFKLNPALFGWQRQVVEWALRMGRCALFLECGLGKTFLQVEWARIVAKACGPVLILAPLAVAEQTLAEAERFGIKARLLERGQKAQPGITITNYERLHWVVDVSAYSGVVLDESSILKSHDGATRTLLIETFKTTPYRLCCTATPSPNDFAELGNHVEFLGLMTRAEFLATWFVHDGERTSEWRLKGHAVRDYWRWVASWAMVARTPQDLGAEDVDARYTLPALNTHVVTVEDVEARKGDLLPVAAGTLSEQRQARRETLDQRVQAAAELANASSGPAIVWCELNDESQALAKWIPDAVEVTGSMDEEAKRAGLVAFGTGKARVIVSKPSIAGHGLNWQHCARQVFVGLSHSWEQYYQAVRRSWRFGQENPVDIHIVTTPFDAGVLANIQRKQGQADTMIAEVVAITSEVNREALEKGVVKMEKKESTVEVARGDGWELHNGDCVTELATLADDSIDYSIFSPPFASLYTYSASEADMGNCTNSETFLEHYRYLAGELLRVIKPGRLCSVHCMTMPTSLTTHGVIGLYDFRGDIVRAMQAAGWVWHSEVCIWKDPVTAMQRTKALGLLYKQLRKDSARSRQGLPDYLLTFRKPGENAEPVGHKPEDFPLDTWQQWASPVWMDIDATDTLQYREAREEQDERHICPLQLEVIRRGVVLWSNPGDVVLSPFAGIGSEGWVSLNEGRQYIGIELKRSYWEQATLYLSAFGAQQCLAL